MAYPVYQLGDIVTMKKPHPCGTNEWEILRTGTDFRLRCIGCGHLVLIPRPKFMKAVRRLVTPVADRPDFVPPREINPDT